MAEAVNSPKLSLLPVAQSVFRKLRQDGYLYVDKTKYLYELITSGKQYYFLSRPRRFGKSLMVSTLQELLSGEQKLFSGLWIAGQNYHWHRYGVIVLDLSVLGIRDLASLKLGICEALIDIIDLYQLNITIELSSPELGLRRVVRALHQKFGYVAILIDEYDDPILQNLKSVTVAEQVRDGLRSFFKAIKGLEQYLGFVFITGVSNFSKSGLFSGLNNLKNLTFNAQFATVCGYTDSEIDQFFMPYLDQWAANQQLSKSDLRSRIKAWYNGYRFADGADSVYNPYSLTNACDMQALDNFWIDSGNPTFLIDELRKESRHLEFQLLNPEELEISQHALGLFDIDNIALPALMVQTGYLTIDNYNTVTQLYKLRYPNLEVRSTLEQYLLAIYTNLNFDPAGKIAKELREALNQQKTDYVVELLQRLFANVAYREHLKDEKFYHGLLQIACKVAGIKVQSEYATSHGSIDLVLDLAAAIYIIEIKFNQSAELALAQIEAKCYYEAFLDTTKHLILLGLNFKKAPGEFKISYKSKQLK